jgi:methylated-DNA-[protein]-cysteine S-methyltransferase
MDVVRYEAPGWGVGEVAAAGGRLLYHELPWPRRSDLAPNYPQGIPEIPVISVAGNSSRNRAGFAERVARRLALYFAGEAERFDDLELDLAGYTPFQQALNAALRPIPRGETVTYGELAALAGRPGAPRAAGNFCGVSRFGIIVPCHRVVAASGLGAYGSFGTEYKRRLLELEGVHVSL